MSKKNQNTKMPSKPLVAPPPVPGKPPVAPPPMPGKPPVPDKPPAIPR